ncbi:hypothetical protein AVEN_119334-1 [Araneus ventricosus]|uniref:Uncharacterized protein n=1 Tax=Araneus ventricosus TaxID=182803 RepID=A0A4Y2TJ97_ARAVE|nr:hypothetical protein AVEN_119334-1 [Araneus ventricosus]
MSAHVSCTWSIRFPGLHDPLPTARTATLEIVCNPRLYPWWRRDRRTPRRPGSSKTFIKMLDNKRYVWLVLGILSCWNYCPGLAEMARNCNWS